MELEMVLNELSLRTSAANIPAARQMMSDFIETIIAATTSKVKRIIRTHSSLDSEELAPGYPVARWRNDNEVDRDLRRFFTALVTKSPFLNDVFDLDILNSANLSDFFYGEDRALGLGVAFLLDGLAVSLNSETRWYESHLQLRIIQLDDKGDLSETIEEIHHASRKGHVREHLDWINLRLKDSAIAEINDGLDIWKRKEEWFPHLFFCERVEEQLRILPQGDLVTSVLRWLQKLEDYCNEWSVGPFNQYKISNNITLDSPPTLETFGKERTFLCPDGVERIFSWHTKIALGEWRIYFDPLPNERKLIIGYIGPHLNTVKFHH